MVVYRKRQALDQSVPNESYLRPSNSLEMSPELKQRKKTQNQDMQHENMNFGRSIRLVVPCIQNIRQTSPQRMGIPAYRDCAVRAEVADKMDESQFLHNRAEDLKFDVPPVPHDNLVMVKNVLTKPMIEAKRLPDLDD